MVSRLHSFVSPSLLQLLGSLCKGAWAVKDYVYFLDTSCKVRVYEPSQKELNVVLHAGHSGKR